MSNALMNILLLVPKTPYKLVLSHLLATCQNTLKNIEFLIAFCVSMCTFFQSLSLNSFFFLAKNFFYNSLKISSWVGTESQSSYLSQFSQTWGRLFFLQIGLERFFILSQKFYQLKVVKRGIFFLLRDLF